MRERAERRTSAERSVAERERERTPALAAAVLGLQRSVGNAATARLLQRAPAHTVYAPEPRHAIATQFRTNHIGRDERHAIDQHASRGTLTTTNTFVAMTNADAAEEIRRCLLALPASADISSWDRLDFTTQFGYWCYATTLLDNATGRYRVRKVFATVRVQAWWNEGKQAFEMGHMHGIGAEDAGSVSTSQLQMA